MHGETNMQRAHRAYRERLSTAFHTAAEQSVTMIANALAWHVRCSPACQGGRHVEYLELEPATAHTEEEIGAAIGAFLEEFVGGELKERYYQQARKYLARAVAERDRPTLFDLATVGE